MDVHHAYLYSSLLSREIPPTAPAPARLRSPTAGVPLLPRRPTNAAAVPVTLPPAIPQRAPPKGRRGFPIAPTDPRTPSPRRVWSQLTQTLVSTRCPVLKDSFERQKNSGGGTPLPPGWVRPRRRWGDQTPSLPLFYTRCDSQTALLVLPVPHCLFPTTLLTTIIGLLGNRCG